MNPEVLLRVFDQPIAFHRCLVSIAGSVNAALLLGQLIYWTPRAASKEGWIYKTAFDLESEIGLGRREQETARRALRSLGFVLEQKRGIPPKIFFLVNVGSLHLALEKAFGGEMPRQPAPTSNLAENAKLISPKAPNQFGGKCRNNTETTSRDSSSTPVPVFSVRNGMATWNEADRLSADRLVEAFGLESVTRAIDQMDVEPLPGRVRRKLEQSARAQRAAAKRASAAVPAQKAHLDVDLAAQAAGEALLKKIRHKKSTQNQGATA